MLSLQALLLLLPLHDTHVIIPQGCHPQTEHFGTDGRAVQAGQAGHRLVCWRSRQSHRRLSVCIGRAECRAVADGEGLAATTGQQLAATGCV